MDRSEDLKFIREELRHLGITEFPEKTLADLVNSGKDKIHMDGKIEFMNYGKKEGMDYKIFFKNYERPNLFHPYLFQVTLKNDPEKSRAFQIRPDAYFTMRDAFNLLNGRAVQKLTYNHQTRKIENQWFQLDTVHKDAYGNALINRFKPNKVEGKIIDSLNSFPIRQLMNPAERANLILSLFNGNAEPVNLLFGGKDIQGYVTVVPEQNAVQVHAMENGQLVKFKLKPSKQSIRIKPKRRSI